MLFRIIWRLLWASRSRLTLALLAIAGGAAVCSALMNLNLDATDKFTREFRTLGANVIISPELAQRTGAAMDMEVMHHIAALESPDVLAAAPYLYVAAHAAHEQRQAPLIVTGTWFDQVARMNSWWKIDGQWVTERNDPAYCMVGREVARQLGISSGSKLTLHYADRKAEFTVASVVTTGDSEDSQVFVSLPAAQALAQTGERITVAQMSVRGPGAAIENVIGRLTMTLPGLEVRPVRQLALAEGLLLERIRGLLFATVVLILLLSALGVLAAMAGLAIERRRDVGLMKALGGSVRQVMRIFLIEAATIGIAGGIMGAGAGILLSEWIGQRVFAASITPRLIVLPITVLIMIAVALAGALPLRLLGRVHPAEILRNE